MRKLIFNLHLYLGLTLGLLLVSAGVTGSALVFREEIDAALNPHLLRVSPGPEPLSLQRIVDRVRVAYPATPPARIQLPREPGETHELTLGGEEGRLVYVDPYRGTILGSRLPTDHFAGWLFEWHTTLLVGETGEQVMGTAALLLLVLVATGGVVWWPGVRRLADGFRVRWGASWKRVNWDVHRVGGIWSTAFLTVVAVTGASLVFHDAFMAGLNRVTHSPPRPVPPVVEVRLGEAVLPLDSLVRLANRALPGGEVTYVTLPAKPEAALTVRKHFAEELHPNGRNFVYLDPWSGEVLAVEHALRAPAGTRAYNVLYPIHIGRWGGIASRIAYALLGLTPLVLFVSGCLMWWNRTRGKRRRGRGVRSAAPVRDGGRRPPPRVRVGGIAPLVLFGVMGGCATAGVARSPAVPVERESYLMGTRLRVMVEASDRAAGLAATERVFGEVRRLEEMLSSWREDTEIARVNAAPIGTPVPASAELLGLLREVERWVRATGGAFDPAVGPLIDAWELRGEGRRPSPEELATARAASGWDAFRIDPRGGTVTRLREGAWIDTGAWGKGAALRAARRILAEAGIHTALLDFGGQIVAVGCPPEGTLGALAVAHPSRRDQSAVELRFCDASASTTSDSERWVEVDGERLGHVLDPRAGRPAPAWGSATVVAEDPLLADVLSTALFVLGRDRGLAWARRAEFGALFLWEDGGRTRAEWNRAMAAFLDEEEVAGENRRSR